MKLWKKVAIFFGVFLTYHIVFSGFFPVDENNVLQAPDWYATTGFGIAFIITALITFRKKLVKSILASIKKSKDRKRYENLSESEKYLIEKSTSNHPHQIPANHLISQEHDEVSSANNSSNSIFVKDNLSDIDNMEGHEFEHWCANLLRKNGFSNVEVTRGSGDQGVDILAQKDGIKYAVQCKCYSKDLGNKPVQEVNAGKMIYHCQIGAVMTNRYFTQGAKEAAEATGVLLWDRDKLNDMIKK